MAEWSAALPVSACCSTAPTRTKVIPAGRCCTLSWPTADESTCPTLKCCWTAAREWAADGIVANLYCPVSTRHYEGTDQLLTEYKQEGMAVVEALSPTGYDGDAEDDIGPVVEFLLSDACRYLTGQTLMLDGGTYAFA